MKPGDRTLALSLGAMALGMVMLAYASVPLYRLFCQVTGFGGTPRQVAAALAPAATPGREITIRFNADIDSALPWAFAPSQREMKVRLGENALAFYDAKNLAGAQTAGHATYNVVPEAAGAYFAKIECFCFKNQPLAPGQAAHMPVSFYIDPAIDQDPNLKQLGTITLSYTFFAAK